MGIFRQFPYTNFHDLNTDWFLSEFKKLVAEWQTTYADWSEWKNDIDHAIEELRELIDTNIYESLREIVEELIESGEFEEILASVLEEMLVNEFIAGDANISYFNNHNNHSTEICWRIIPNEYEPFIAYSSDNTKLPIAMAAEAAASSAVNASRWKRDTGDYYGYFRVDNTTLNDNEFNDPEVSTDSVDILCYKNNHLYTENIRTSTESLDNENYTWAITGFETIIENGLPRPDATPGGSSESLTFHPRSFIAQTNSGDYIIGSTDGRSPSSEGCTLSDIVRFLQTVGNDIEDTIITAYSLDGGGSVCLYEKGYRINPYINNENRAVKSMICFKKSTSTFSNNLKQAKSLDNEIYKANNTNANKLQNDIISYSDDTVKEIGFHKLEDLTSQAFIRFSRERLYAGVAGDFSDDSLAHLLIDIGNTYFNYMGVSRYLPEKRYTDANIIRDQFPTANDTGIWRVQITSSSVAISLGLTAEDYGHIIYVRIRGAVNYDLIMTRANVFYRYADGTPQRLTN